MMRTQTAFLLALPLVFSLACKADVDPGDEGADEVGEEEEEEGETDAPMDESGDDTFIPEEDFSSASSCDPFAQDCPDGEKCVAYASSGGTWDANKCVAVMGDAVAGDECTYFGAVEGTDTCDEDTVCWNALEVDGQLIGTCFPFCTGSADNPTCEDDYICRIVNMGAINVCLPPCDPLLQECDEGLGCYWSGGSGTFQCIIVAGEGIPTGDPCGFNNDCAPGNFCAAAEATPNCAGTACCANFCDLTEDPAPCAEMTECVGFFEENSAPPGFEDLGVCVIPA